MISLYDFARWLYVDKQKKQKFDSISAGHEAALIAMGVITDATQKDDGGPECPSLFVSTFEKYRELKFVQRDNGDSIVIYPRDLLRWQDLTAYKEATGQRISYLETELIMGLDAIFEGREDG